MEKTYQSVGFKRKGVLRDAIYDGEEYADDILMAILEDEWRQIKLRGE
nr:GNAT family protein [uncultured Cellulosilyticum sp.]